MSRQTWTKEQYLNWLKTRGEIETWEHADCRAADDHIKRETMINFRVWVKDNIHTKHVGDWMVAVVNAHFGSADVDEMLVKLNCYPTWMERQ